jgi:hypothetical protein
VTSFVAGYEGNDSITLVKSTDIGEAGAGNDSITLNVSGTAKNTVSGGSGNDTLFFGTNVTNVGASINMGGGDDLVANSSGDQYVGVSLGGNAGSDTIQFAAGALNSTIGGGSNADSIAFTAGTITNSLLFGGGGADTLNMVGALNAVTLTTIQSGDGHDKLNATGLIGSTTLVVASGKGLDSITFGASTVGTVAGGAGADTINFLGAYGGGKVYGDGVGVTSGALNGADKISLTGGTVAALATVYGGGGKDTITFANAVSATSLIVFGDGGADLIGNTAQDFFDNGASTVNGGAGHDVIKFTNVSNSGFVAGGAGFDSIYQTNGGVGVGTIDGGSGNDTIQIGGNTSSALTAVVTIVGGAGADSIVLGSFTAATISGLDMTNSALSANVLAGIQFGGSGDVIRFDNTANAVAASANWLNATQITIQSPTALTAGTLANGLSAAGSVMVSDTGDDLLIGIVGSTASTIIYTVILGGDELIKTTAVGAQTLNASNFGFTLGTVGGKLGFTIT